LSELILGESLWTNYAGKHVLRDVAEGPLRNRKRDENMFKFTHEKSRTANRNKRRFNEYLVADSREKHLQCDVDKGRKIACQLLTIATEVTDTALLVLKTHDLLQYNNRTSDKAHLFDLCITNRVRLVIFASSKHTS